MELIDGNRIDTISKTTESEIEELKFQSETGDKEASLQLMVYYFWLEQKLNRSAIRYMLLAAKQGNNFLANTLGDLYLKGHESNDFKIEPSPRKAFRFFLMTNSFSAFKSLRSLANDDDKLWEPVVESAANNRLHPIYNDLINTISKSIPNDISKIKAYTEVIDDIINFFVEERRKMVIESNLNQDQDLSQDEMLTHYSDINALHSMLRLPTDKKDLEKYKKEYPVVRLYNVAYMNDPEEGIFIYDKETFNELVPYLGEENYYYTYLSSFTSSNPDDLTMWRLYGRDGKGISITIPMKTLFPVSSMLESCCSDLQKFIGEDYFVNAMRNEKNICLYKVQYDGNEMQTKISEQLMKLKTVINDNGDCNNEELVNSLMRSFVQASDEVRFLYKSSQYSIESEYRFLSFQTLESEAIKMDERAIPRLYINSKPIFKEGTIITIGPKVEDKIAIKLELEYRLKKYGCDGVSVVISNAKYR